MHLTSTKGDYQLGIDLNLSQRSWTSFILAQAHFRQLTRSVNGINLCSRLRWISTQGWAWSLLKFELYLCSRVHLFQGWARPRSLLKLDLEPHSSFTFTYARTGFWPQSLLKLDQGLYPHSFMSIIKAWTPLKLDLCRTQATSLPKLELNIHPYSSFPLIAAHLLVLNLEVALNLYWSLSPTSIPTSSWDSSLLNSSHNPC